MPRLSTDDERRFRDIARVHNRLITALYMDTRVPEGMRDRALGDLDETLKLIDSIRVRGDAERERRATADSTAADAQSPLKA